MNFPEENNEEKPRAYHVDDDNNLEEKDLKRSFLFGQDEDANPDQPGYESHGAGGQNFGKTNVTTSGDDEANPSQNAGYSNAYFARTEPSEEHPEDLNFKPEDQQGAPHEDGANGTSSNGERIQEGTADYDGGTQHGEREDTNPDQSKMENGN
ncbi:hypothetical protein [Mucilaginibacter ginkgonis]|uniref:Uncharacterized protein n=1 Tax=Mucilaginibacter ginkgonis TaxID=2682091 RepID=A0A6I4IN14_9SPHI|nr:hypothetical protein [Mucilaginibacter ginkgonis]QQL50986.1 hypothetical protein GO620_005915 [Mucilaginibacter ginkgonis]